MREERVCRRRLLVVHLQEESQRMRRAREGRHSRSVASERDAEVIEAVKIDPDNARHARGVDVEKRHAHLQPRLPTLERPERNDLIDVAPPYESEGQRKRARADSISKKTKTNRS
jgi:hypothetical protein